MWLGRRRVCGLLLKVSGLGGTSGYQYFSDFRFDDAGSPLSSYSSSSPQPPHHTRQTTRTHNLTPPPTQPTAAGGEEEDTGLGKERVGESTRPLSFQAPPPRPSSSQSITIRARGSGSAGGVGGGTTGGSSINSGGSSPHALHPTTAATAATFSNSMGDWEELKRKVRGIESKLEVRSECARRQC